MAMLKRKKSLEIIHEDKKYHDHKSSRVDIEINLIIFFL